MARASLENRRALLGARHKQTSQAMVALYAIEVDEATLKFKGVERRSANRD